MKQIVRNKKTKNEILIDAVDAAEYCKYEKDWEIVNSDPVVEIPEPQIVNTAGKKIKPKPVKKG